MPYCRLFMELYISLSEMDSITYIQLLLYCSIIFDNDY
jgi:hypothetical protein